VPVVEDFLFEILYGFVVFAFLRDGADALDFVEEVVTKCSEVGLSM
jgi:hypothetical protein